MERQIAALAKQQQVATTISHPPHLAVLETSSNCTHPLIQLPFQSKSWLLTTPLPRPSLSSSPSLRPATCLQDSLKEEKMKEKKKEQTRREQVGRVDWANPLLTPKAPASPTPLPLSISTHKRTLVPFPRKTKQNNKKNTIIRTPTTWTRTWSVTPLPMVAWERGGLSKHHCSRSIFEPSPTSLPPPYPAPLARHSLLSPTP